MPKNKAKAISSDSDEGPEDRTPAKKPKKEVPKTSTAGSSDKTNSDGWELGRNRRVSLTEFKGKWYINIREYYQSDTGEYKPGKKGIMLTMEQWEAFKKIVPEIIEEVKRRV